MASKQRFSGVYVAHHNVLDVISCTGCFCVGCSNDVALRLQEDSFVTSFPPGWRFMKVWETATRQDAELLVHVFRCCCSAVSTLLLLPRGAPQLLNRLTPPNPQPLIQSQLQGVPAWWQHWHLRACVAATSDNCARNGTDHNQGSRIKEDPVSARESTRHVSSTNSYSAWCHRLRPERPPPTAFGQRHYCQRRAAAETTLALFRRQQASDLIGAVTVFVQRACQSVCCVG